jgi:hypothetical protein
MLTLRMATTKKEIKTIFIISNEKVSVKRKWENCERMKISVDVWTNCKASVKSCSAFITLVGRHSSKKKKGKKERKKMSPTTNPSKDWKFSLPSHLACRPSLRFQSGFKVVCFSSSSHNQTVTRWITSHKCRRFFSWQSFVSAYLIFWIMNVNKILTIKFSLIFKTFQATNICLPVQHKQNNAFGYSSNFSTPILIENNKVVWQTKEMETRKSWRYWVEWRKIRTHQLLHPLMKTGNNCF